MIPHVHSTCTSYLLYAYLYCIYALVGGSITICDPYICVVHEFLATNHTLSSTGPIVYTTHTHTYNYTATARVIPHVHSTCTSYLLYAYLYCIYALVGGSITICDPYICVVHEFLATNHTLSSTGPIVYTTHTHTYNYTATARVIPHVHSTCTSYLLYAYLYCIYALVGGSITICDPYICVVHEFLATNHTLSSTGPIVYTTHTHTYNYTATARVIPHVHSTCTSYLLYAYLYCIYALVGGSITICDPYICVVHEFLATNHTLSSTGPIVYTIKT